jgi:hypothetical protein
MKSDAQSEQTSELRSPGAKEGLTDYGRLTSAWLGNLKKEAMERLTGENGGKQSLEEYFNDIIE